MLSSDLDARSRRWATTSDPAFLWPGLDVGSLSAAALAIERSAARILAGKPATLGAADGTDAHIIGIAALISGTGPLLGYWVESGLLDVSSPVATVLSRHLAHGRGRIARIHREIRPALNALMQAGVSPGILKGFHTAQVYFPEPSVRPLGDVDVYVEPHCVARAATALAAAGFSGGGKCGVGKTEWFPRGTIPPIRSFEFWHVRSPWKIELHDTLAFGSLIQHGVRLEATMPVATVWEWEGLPLRVASQPLLFAALATHTSSELYNSRLIRVIELTLVARQDIASGAMTWESVIDFLERTRATRFAHPALALMEQLAPGTVDSRLLKLARDRSTRIARAVVEELTPATPILHERVSLAERLMWEPNLLGIARRLCRMLVPERAGTLRDDLDVYLSRFRRLLTGRVAWRIGGPAKSHAARM